MKKILVLFILCFISFGNYLDVFAESLNIEQSSYLNNDLIKKYENEFSNKLSKKILSFSVEQLKVVLGKIDKLAISYENKNLKNSSKEIIFSQLFVLQKIIKTQIEEKLKIEEENKIKAEIERKVKIEVEKKLALEKEREKIKQEEDLVQLKIATENRKKSEQERLQKEKEYEANKQHNLLISKIEEQRQKQMEEENERQKQIELENERQKKLNEEKQKQIELENERQKKLNEEKQKQIEEEIKSHIADSTYPGCDSPDIKYGDYIVSACNVGTNKSGTGVESYGDYFLPGDAVPITSTSSLIRKNWKIMEKTPGSITEFVGPCADGYHIPSKEEWKGIINFGKWWHTVSGIKTFELSNSLKLPLSGYKYLDNASVKNKDISYNGYYWSSSNNYSIYDPDQYFIGVSLVTGNDSFTSRYKHNNAFNLRCFKNR